MGAWIETVEPPTMQPVNPVALLVGAWIETICLRVSLTEEMSHSSWVRGLKLILVGLLVIVFPVALLVGAWIETVIVYECYHLDCVALLVGAWIET